MIQRDYAQGRKNEVKVREGFVSSLAALINGKAGTLDFIYGALEGQDFVPLDGQQRLTTLYLLHWLSAKREKRPTGDYGFLADFSYRTRANSRYFCQHLVDHTPSETGNIAEDIRDQKWYRLEWNDDPTIDSMLRMLTYLDSVFYPDKDNITPIWDKLDRIKFYGFDLEDLGLTDDIYIKMNSRGKPLTDFEHFKAAFDNVSRSRLASKIDIEYTNRMWRMGNESIKTEALRQKDKDKFIPEVDDYLLNFIHTVSRMLSLATKGAEPSDDPMDWLNDIYSHPSRVTMLEHALDSIIMPEADGICERFFENDDSDPDKINIDNTDIHLIDLACVEGNSKLGYTELLLLYSLLLYLSNHRIYEPGDKAYITIEQMCRRMRVLRNLLKKSNNELRTERMPEIFREVGTLILHGTLSTNRKALNDNQKNEEIRKSDYIAANPASEKAIAAIENHTLLLGSLGAIGWTQPGLFDTFRTAFKRYSAESAMLSRAMLTHGDFMCKENSWRRRIGGGEPGLVSLWRDTFFVTNDNKRIADVLPLFLNAYDAASRNGKNRDEILNDMIDAYAPAHHDLRYYVVKYPTLLAHACYGKFFKDDSSWQMGWIALKTAQKPGQNWSVIHLAIMDSWKPKAGQVSLKLGNYRDFLQLGESNQYLDCTQPVVVNLYQRESDNTYTLVNSIATTAADVDIVNYIVTHILPTL